MRYVPTPSGLAPFDAAARDFLGQLTSAEPIELEMLHPRDMVEHRKIMVQIAELAKAIGRDPERVRAELLYKTGNFQVIGELFGKVLISINSMSRHHMKDPELHAFWDDARQVIATEMLPQIADAAARERLTASLLPER
jgi:hypothetical protein